MRPTLIVHGGAGAANPELGAAQSAGCRAALHAGWQVLEDGGRAVDAVCAAVAQLEDDPLFNAGVGSCLTSAGTVEMDAAVMHGADLRAGAVAAVRTVRNPIRVARAIMDDGRHVLLVGAGAQAFATACGVPTCDPGELITERQLRRWQQRREPPAPATLGTVGAVAVDRDGHVAAATSTGGTFNKHPGRVGDTALIGAGTYADDSLGAASATGDGEAIIRLVLAKSVVTDLGDGNAPQRAAQLGIQTLGQRAHGTGGIIVVDFLGRFGYAHNSAHMTVGYMYAGLSEFVIHG
jgi:beta-aspartyl-peptidase (threonine type)